MLQRLEQLALLQYGVAKWDLTLSPTQEPLMSTITLFGICLPERTLDFPQREKSISDDIAKDISSSSSSSS